MKLYNVQPNGLGVFLGDIALRYRWFILVSDDVFCTCRNYFSNHNNLLKVLTVFFGNYVHRTVAYSATQEIESFYALYNSDSDFPVPSLLFQVALIPSPKGEWGIRLPDRFITGTRASPARIDTTFYTKRRLSGSKHTYKGKRGRLPKTEFQGLRRWENRSVLSYMRIFESSVTQKVPFGIDLIALLYSHIYTPAIK